MRLPSGILFLIIRPLVANQTYQYDHCQMPHAMAELLFHSSNLCDQYGNGLSLGSPDIPKMMQYEQHCSTK
jgi:hypothetical protein